MFRQSKVILTLGLIFVAIVVGWFVAASFLEPAHADKRDTAQSGGANILDGLTFVSELGPLGEPADVKDTLVFADGMFLSTECERRCNYPAGPYFIRQMGGKTEFVAESLCPDKDATIQWRGIIDNDVISGEFTWTVNRWYWTVEKKFWFEGTLAKGVTPIASN